MDLTLQALNVFSDWMREPLVSDLREQISKLQKENDKLREDMKRMDAIIEAARDRVLSDLSSIDHSSDSDSDSLFDSSGDEESKAH